MTTPPKPGRDPSALKGLRAAFGYALEGIVYAWHHQRNFRIEVYLGSIAVGLALWLQIHLVLVLSLVALVLGLELLNTAIEALVDLVSPNFHPLAKIAKDTAAAAVLVVSLLVLVVGVVLFWPPLSQLWLW
jgi:diacylglycerol kinase (ATP)